MALATDAAGRIKELLSVRQVVEHYGFRPNRAGFICCPFHKEKTASLKLYENGWKCFGCGAGGSVIDFTMKLYGIDFRQALLRLDMDFGLGVTGMPGPTRAERSAILEARRREAERREALAKEYRENSAEYQYWFDVMKYFAPQPGETSLHPLYADALAHQNRQAYLEWWLEEHLGEG